MNKPPTWRALLLICAACGAPSGQTDRPTEVASATAKHPVEVVIPSVLKGLPMPHADHRGRPTVTPCATCHGQESERPLPDTAAQVAGPHAGLALRHGSLRCASCHHATKRDALHLADGSEIPLIQAMALCSQCHGTQKRDFDHGAHGGMRGFWDLTRGPRERNHCVACHDPHAPQFGRFTPMPAARDRFISSETSHHD